jgi:mannose-1-phosphate guanylyltransferase/mannose-6-phosphate isomerase
MVIVIIAGGSGTRLWPLSTPDYPKHLLKVDGDTRSLLQHTYTRARQVTDKVYIVSEASHVDHVKEQIPDLPEDRFIVEPARRGTANCIVAALAYVSKRHDKYEPIAAIHSDHFIRDDKGFIKCFQLVETVCKKEKRIVLVGVKPNYPATCFGYIQKDGAIEGNPEVFNVHSFKEKPEIEVAKQYLASGEYLWNCGYFIGSINTFTHAMQQHAPELYETYEKLRMASPEEYESIYLGLTANAIDYALIEKVPDLLVVPASFDWIDIGSFNDLHKAMSNDSQGNYIHGQVEIDEVKNSIVENHEDKPVVVIGLDSVVVINTPDGVLVTPKDHSQKVGEISKRLYQEDNTTS